jgi:hypothetical protein
MYSQCVSRPDPIQAVVSFGALSGQWSAPAGGHRAVLIGLSASSPRAEIEVPNLEQGIFYTPRDAEADGIRNVDLHGFSQHHAECIVRDVMGHRESQVPGSTSSRGRGSQRGWRPENAGIVEVFQ